jgi:hypothetical protein
MSFTPVSASMRTMSRSFIRYNFAMIRMYIIYHSVLVDCTADDARGR